MEKVPPISFKGAGLAGGESVPVDENSVIRNKGDGAGCTQSCEEKVNLGEGSSLFVFFIFFGGGSEGTNSQCCCIITDHDSELPNTCPLGKRLDGPETAQTGNSAIHSKFWALSESRGTAPPHFLAECATPALYWPKRKVALVGEVAESI